MDTNSTSILNHTHKWIENGLPVDGIPYLEQISKVDLLMVEAICSDLIFTGLFLFAIHYIIKSYKKIIKIEEEIIEIKTSFVSEKKHD